MNNNSFFCCRFFYYDCVFAMKKLTFLYKIVYFGLFFFLIHFCCKFFFYLFFSSYLFLYELCIWVALLSKFSFFLLYTRRKHSKNIWMNEDENLFRRHWGWRLWRVITSKRERKGIWLIALTEINVLIYSECFKIDLKNCRKWKGPHLELMTVFLHRKTSNNVTNQKCANTIVRWI